MERQEGLLSLRTRIATGLIASAMMTLLMVGLRFALDTPVLPEVIADWITGVTPPAVFDFFLTRLQFSAKPLLFGSLLVGQVVVGTGLGVLYINRSSRLPFEDSQPWPRGLLLAVVLWLLAVVAITPLMGGGLLGASIAGSMAAYLTAMFLAVAGYGVSLTHLHHMALAREAGPQVRDRREFIQRAVFYGLALVAGAYSLRAIVRGIGAVSPARSFRNLGQMQPEVTPNEEFYEVSKNIVNPRVDAASWSLSVGGDDLDGAFSLGYEELQELPSIEEYVTLTCISNLVGGDLISNALWRGVPLKLLMERAGFPESTQRVAFRAEDGYVDSFPMEIAMRDNVIVAYQMNGVPLPDSHGFPARIIVPGLYGMENVKWLTEIEPVPAEFRGYWQQRGWADTAVINTMSRIDVPHVRLTLAVGEVEVGGIAFAGDRGIRSVEISTDEGLTWQRTELSDPLSPYTWSLWTTVWEPPVPNRYSITVRATADDGRVQTSEVRPNLPFGATGHHEISVRVA